MRCSGRKAPVRRWARGLAATILALTAGCALKGDVRKVGLQVDAVQAQLARSDSARRAERDTMVSLIAAVQQALATQQSYLVQMRGDVRTDLLAVQQQLVTVQELTGQSQQRLSELRARVEERAQQTVQVIDTGARTGPPVGPSGNPAGPGAAQMWDLAMQQFRASRYGTARVAFRELLRVFPTDEHAPDALYYIGECFAQDHPDSAGVVYEQVVKSYPNSTRAPSSLYKLGLLAEQRSDKAAARAYYSRVIAGYSRSAEADLARQNLQRLGR